VSFPYQTAGLALAIVLVGLFIWYMLQPPDVATLFARVEANSDDVQGLSTVRDDIDNLLSNYGQQLDISQRAKLEGYQEELELDRLERQLDRESRRITGKRLTPVERAYLDAIVTLKSNKNEGLRKLKAMVGLFGIAPDGAKTTQRCLELARRQISRIEDVMDDAALDDKTYIESRIIYAQEYVADDPDDARRIYEGILETYGDRPWAKEVLDRVRSLLNELPPQEPTEAPPLEAVDASETVGESVEESTP
jgi:serine/threonine-protein kinase